MLLLATKRSLLSLVSAYQSPCGASLIVRPACCTLSWCHCSRPVPTWLASWVLSSQSLTVCSAPLCLPRLYSDCPLAIRIVWWSSICSYSGSLGPPLPFPSPDKVSRTPPLDSLLALLLDCSLSRTVSARRLLLTTSLSGCLCDRLPPLMPFVSIVSYRS